MTKRDIQALINKAPSSWVKMFKRYKLGKKPTVDQLIDVVLDYTPSMRSSGATGKAKFQPPKKVREEAMEGIRLSWENNYTSASGIGLVRAMQLVVEPKIWERSVKRMHSYFARSKKDTPKRYMAWLNWGGDSGKKWADQIVSKHSLTNPRRRRNSGLPPKLIAYHCGKRKPDEAWNAVQFLGQGENFGGGRITPPNGWGIYFASARNDRKFESMTNQEYYDRVYAWRTTTAEKRDAPYCRYAIFPYLSIVEIDTSGLMGEIVRQLTGDWFPSPAIRAKFEALTKKHSVKGMSGLWRTLGIEGTHKALKKIGITGQIGGAGISWEIAVFDPSIITDLSVEPMFDQAYVDEYNAKQRETKNRKRSEQLKFRKEIKAAIRANEDPWEIYDEYEFEWGFEGWLDLIEWGKTYIEYWTTPEGRAHLDEMSQYGFGRRRNMRTGGGVRVSDKRDSAIRMFMKDLYAKQGISVYPYEPEDFDKRLFWIRAQLGSLPTAEIDEQVVKYWFDRYDGTIQGKKINSRKRRLRRRRNGTRLVPKEQVRMVGFTKAKTKKATPHIPVVLGFIEELLGEEILFPTPIRPMTKEEFQEGRCVVDNGHPRGAGHGQYDELLQEVAVNGNMAVDDIVANILHENLHHARPRWSEERVRDTTGQAMEYLYGFYTLGKPYAEGRLKANPKRRSNKSTRKIPARYLTGYKGKELTKRKAEIQERRSEYQAALAKYGDESSFPLSTRRKLYRPFETDKGKKSRSSSYTVKAKERGFVGSLNDKARAASKYYGGKIPVSVLKTVRDRGMAAWASGGHRAGQTPHSWGIARVNSFLVGGKTFFTADFDQVSLLPNNVSVKIASESVYAPNLSALWG